MTAEIVTIELAGKRKPMLLTTWSQGSALTPIDDDRQVIKPNTAGKVARVLSWNKKTGKVERFKPV